MDGGLQRDGYRWFRRPMLKSRSIAIILESDRNCTRQDSNLQHPVPKTGEIRVFGLENRDPRA